MKKIIDNKVYNTETAEEIGSWESMDNVRDFQYVCETLYRKRTGEYFLHGFGNAASKYSHLPRENEWTSGEQIMPLSYKSAKKWAKMRLGEEKYLEEFGEPVEEEGTQSMTVHIPASLHNGLKKKQAETGKSMTQLVIESLESTL